MRVPPGAVPLPDNETPEGTASPSVSAQLMQAPAGPFGAVRGPFGQDLRYPTPGLGATRFIHEFRSRRRELSTVFHILST